MATLLFTAAGYAVGSLFGFPQLGAIIGSAIGSQVLAPDLPDQQAFGPRLSDLKVTSSAYGNMIPFGYGAFRAAGNVVWASLIHETANTTSVSVGGGKGGGGGGATQTQTTYTYSIDAAIAVHDGEIIGVRRIWANGKLIFDARVDGALGSLLASNNIASSIRVYTGTESQTPDSLIEAFEGVGEVPAYRGVAYIVFEDLQLADYGNRLPNFEFEIVTAGSIVTGDLTAAYLATTTNREYEPTAMYHSYRLSTQQWINESGGAGTPKFALVDTATGLRLFGITMPDSTAYHAINSGHDGHGYVSRLAFFGGNRIWRLNKDTQAVDYIDVGSLSLNAILQQINGELWGSNDFNTAIYRISNIDWAAHTCTATTISSFPTLVGRGEYFTNAGAISGRVYLCVSVSGTGYWGYLATATNTFVSLADDSVTAFASRGTAPLVGFDGYIYAVLGTGEVVQYDRDGTLLQTSAVMPSFSNWGSYGGVFLYDTFGRLWTICYSSLGAPVYNVLRSTDLSVVDTITGLSGASYPSFFLNREYYQGVPALYGAISGGNFGSINLIISLDYDRIQPTPMGLDEVVLDLCERSGLDASDVDVTSLSTTQVLGYVVGQRTTIRSMIEPLMLAYFFDAVESDWQLKFIKRGGASVRTIETDDLAAREDSEGEPQEPLVQVRKQDLELPLEIAISYFDRDSDYQLGSQSSRRLVGASLDPRSLQLPVVLTADQAKQAADAAIFSLWFSRTGLTFATSRKHLAIEPCDIITIPYGNEELAIRVTAKKENPFGAIAFDAVLDDAENYSQAAVGAAGITTDTSLNLYPITTVALLDIPMLRDIDNDPGFYAIARGEDSTWRGAQLYRTLIASTSYGAVTNGNLLVAGGVGSALSALPDLTAHGPGIIDEVSYVDVLVPGYTLSSITRDDLLDYLNAAVLMTPDGPEVIQYRDADLIDTDTYRLSGLMRGRLGTESCMASHAVGEVFAVLDDNIRSLPQSFYEVNKDYNYKPVTIGATLQQTPVTFFSNTGRRKKPLSPILLAGGRNGSDDLMLQWRRRSRFYSSMRDGVDAPLGENTESYAVEILNAGVVVRIISGSVQSAEYTAAQQTEDFGSPQSSIDVAVYQLSDDYGRGEAAEGTF